MFCENYIFMTYEESSLNLRSLYISKSDKYGYKENVKKRINNICKFLVL